MLQDGSSIGLQIPSKKVWGVFRGFNTFLEGIWSPRVWFLPTFLHISYGFYLLFALIRQKRTHPGAPRCLIELPGWDALLPEPRDHQGEGCFFGVCFLFLFFFLRAVFFCFLVFLKGCLGMFLFFNRGFLSNPREHQITRASMWLRNVVPRFSSAFWFQKA